MNDNEPPAHGDEAKWARLLVVDDEPNIVRMLEEALGRAGYRNVISTSDSKEAVELHRMVRPDLVILDLHMPEKSGLEVLEELHPETSTDEYLPILVLTGDPRPEARLQALLLGAKDFVSKPFDTVELMLRVRILLETRLLVERLRARLPGSA